MKKFICLSTIVFGIIGLLNIQSAQAMVMLDLVPSSATVSIGDMFDVDVIISGLGNPPSVGAFDLDVSFDPVILSPTGVTFGLFLGDPALFEALTDFNFFPGVVDFAEVSLLSPSDLDALQLPSFTLATLSFTAIDNGRSQLGFVGERRVDDAFGNKLPVPEPSTLLLFGSGLAGLIGLGRKRLFKKL